MCTSLSGSQSDPTLRLQRTQAFLLGLASFFYIVVTQEPTATVVLKGCFVLSPPRGRNGGHGRATGRALRPTFFSLRVCFREYFFRDARRSTLDRRKVQFAA